jgi:hypothetical protein
VNEANRIANAFTLTDCEAMLQLAGPAITAEASAGVNGCPPMVPDTALLLVEPPPPPPHAASAIHAIPMSDLRM